MAILAAVLVLADPFDLHGIDQGFYRVIGLGSSLAETKAPELWTCPMHPQILQREPGSCPICKMDLVPVKSTTADPSDEPAESAGDEGRAVDNAEEGPLLWTCGMHPQVLQGEPGSCPICKMDLTPVRTQGSSSSHDDDAAGPAIQVSSSVIQQMNVRTEVVERGDLRREIRTVGYLDYDPDRVVSVTTKFSGFIEQTYANYVGQAVRRGEPLFEIYAPELVQTARELISAQQYAAKMSEAPADARRGAEALVAAAKERMAFWDVSSEGIAADSDPSIVRTFAMRAPAGGVITRRAEGLEGMAVQPGTELLQIADLSRLWLSVEVFEDQLQWIQAGSEVTVTLPYFPGHAFHGKVRYLEPRVSAETRSVRVSLEVPNTDQLLRAGMYATVTFAPVIVPDAITVSEQAVLRTGHRDVVVVAQGEGRFEPRAVVLGPGHDGRIQVLEGLRPGETIVSSAQFLIDSESNLQAAMQRLMAEHAH